MIILKILLMIIFYLFIFLLSILFILLISPIKGSASIDTSSIRLKGSYLFGILKIEYNQTLIVKILGFNLSMGDSDDEEDSESNEKKDVKEKKKKSFGRPSLEILHLTLDLIKKLIRIIAPKEARLQLTLGLDDPYYTEMAHIISMVLFLPLNSRKKYTFHLTPVLNDIAIDYKGYARINFSIIQLILPLLRFIIRKPVREYFNIKIIKRKP